MKTYEAKTLIDGFRIGVDGNWYYVGVPAGKLPTRSEQLMVTFRGAKKIYTYADKWDTEQRFPDKFGRGQFYKLYYFKYTPKIINTPNTQGISKKQEIKVEQVPLTLL